MSVLTTIGLFGFVLCGWLFIVAWGGRADATIEGDYATGPTLKRLTTRLIKVFAIVGIACGLLAGVSALAGF